MDLAMLLQAYGTIAEQADVMVIGLALTRYGAKRKPIGLTCPKQYLRDVTFLNMPAA